MNDDAAVTADQERASWTVLSLLEWSTAYLSERGFESPRLNCELLLCHILGLERLELYLNFDRPLSREETTKYKALFRRRLRHEPVQYILGTTEFMGARLRVDPRVLIPRPDTEVLVEQAVTCLTASGAGAPYILDIGTGSGAIAIGLARLVGGCTILAIDASRDALELARDNARINGLSSRISFMECDFLRDANGLPSGAFDLVVSNPPYITAAEFGSLPAEVRAFEPAYALCDGADGLMFYREIARQGQRLLRPGGRIIVEIGYGQSGAVQAIFEEQGLRAPEAVKDYAGIERVLKTDPL